jgi:hypothetical protein
MFCGLKNLAKENIMYSVKASMIFWHDKITPINGFPDVVPDSESRQKINMVGCDRVIAARFISHSEPIEEGKERPVEWLMQAPRSDGRSPLYAWVPMVMVENSTAEQLSYA